MTKPIKYIILPENSPYIIVPELTLQILNSFHEKKLEIIKVSYIDGDIVCEVLLDERKFKLIDTL